MKKVTDKKNSTGLTRGIKIGIIAMVIIFSTLIALIFGLIVFNATRTYPLGNDGRVVYLGKEHSGDGIVAPSYNLYYYNTDLTPEELAEYFGAEITKDKEPIEVSYPIFKINNEEVEVTFYWIRNSEYSTSPRKFNNAPMKYIFETSEEGYEILKQSLKK